LFIFLGPAAKSLLENASFERSKLIAMRTRSAIVSLVFQKSLHVDLAYLPEGTGAIINYISVDLNDIHNAFGYSQLVWGPFLEVALCLLLLYAVIGVAAFAGTAIMLVMTPISSLITKRMSKCEGEVLKKKDERMSITSEVLQGIRIIKWFVWEDSYRGIISDIRKLEVLSLRASWVWQAALNVTSGITPTLIGVVTFLIHTQVLGRPLTPSMGFVALLLFNSMLNPMRVLPWAISTVVRAKLSLDRIRKFLAAKEISGLRARKMGCDVGDEHSYDGVLKDGKQGSLPYEMVTRRARGSTVDIMKSFTNMRPPKSSDFTILPSDEDDANTGADGSNGDGDGDGEGDDSSDDTVVENSFQVSSCGDLAQLSTSPPDTKRGFEDDEDNIVAEFQNVTLAWPPSKMKTDAESSEDGDDTGCCSVAMQVDKCLSCFKTLGPPHIKRSDSFKDISRARSLSSNASFPNIFPTFGSKATNRKGSRKNGTSYEQIDSSMHGDGGDGIPTQIDISVHDYCVNAEGDDGEGDYELTELPSVTSVDDDLEAHVTYSNMHGHQRTLEDPQVDYDDNGDNVPHTQTKADEVDSDRVILSDVNVRIPKGSLTVIVGPTGAGKSTLISGLLGTYGCIRTCMCVCMKT
jgi:ABC-type multidrug transport system fused ATPase/permease subunit